MRAHKYGRNTKFGSLSILENQTFYNVKIEKIRMNRKRIRTQNIGIALCVNTVRIYYIVEPCATCIFILFCQTNFNARNVTLGIRAIDAQAGNSSPTKQGALAAEAMTLLTMPGCTAACIGRWHHLHSLPRNALRRGS